MTQKSMPPLHRMCLLHRMYLLNSILRSLSHLLMMPQLLILLQHLLLFREVSIRIWWCHRILRMIGLRSRTWSKCPVAKVYPASTPFIQQTLFGNFLNIFNYLQIYFIYHNYISNWISNQILQVSNGQLPWTICFINHQIILHWTASELESYTGPYSEDLLQVF